MDDVIHPVDEMPRTAREEELQIEIARLKAWLNKIEEDDRMTFFDEIRRLYCVFCGKRHPKGKMCSCWNN